MQQRPPGALIGEEPLDVVADDVARRVDGLVAVADADRIEVARLEDVEEMLRCGDFILNVFEQKAHTERCGKGLQVLDNGNGVLDGEFIPCRLIEAEIDHGGSERDLLRGLDGALDLVHGGDAGLFALGDEVKIRRYVAGPLDVIAVGEIDGLMQHRAHVVRAEPVSEFAHSGRVGVVEVVARGEDFDGARTSGCQGIQQAGV